MAEFVIARAYLPDTAGEHPDLSDDAPLPRGWLYIARLVGDYSPHNSVDPELLRSVQIDIIDTGYEIGTRAVRTGQGLECPIAFTGEIVGEDRVPAEGFHFPSGSFLGLVEFRLPQDVDIRDLQIAV